ncbi:GmrSD restriction endonuclease domain-containing protein [Caproiciproducens sp.]
MEQLMIRDIISQIYSGALRIPSFQRGFVWEPEDVAFFMDSLYKKYPVGAILIWRTKERLHSERNLGRYSLPEPKEEYPIDYILDGQQRITSIFSVFQTHLTPAPGSNWMDIYYVIGSKTFQQQPCFIALADSDVDPSKHFPLNVLFDPVKYRKAVNALDDRIAVEIDEMFGVFQSVAIPVQIMHTDNKGNVAIVFERINRAGVPLDPFQLLTAWSWSTEFDLQDKLDELSAELSDYGFDGLAEDQDLLMKCFTGFILGSTSPSAIMDLDGEKFRTNFEAITNGLKSAVDFIRGELHLYSLEFVPYPAMIVSLVKFFGSSRTNGNLYSEKQRSQLVRWFWRCCFSRRYSSGVNSAHAADLLAMNKLRENGDTEIANFKCVIPDDFFLTNSFALTSVNTKTFIALLASRGPKSFISGSNVDLSVTLKHASTKEFHHIFPDKYLQRSGKERKEIYFLANFCFLNNSDNQKIKDKAPSDYVKMIDQTKLTQILDAAICPHDTFSLSYEDFISERNKMLNEYAKSLIK